MPLQLEDELLQAVKDGEEALVQMLLQAEADPNAGAWARSGHTAVSQAIMNGHEKILDELLNHGHLYGMVEERGPQKIPQRPAQTNRSLRSSFGDWVARVQLAAVRAMCSWGPKEHDWMPPAERTFRAILRSTAGTESMVLKLLDAGMLASQPYGRSEVARKLFELSLDKCWPTLTGSLLSKSVSVDSGPDETFKECCWPSFIGTMAEIWPDIDAQRLPEFLLYRRRVLSFLDGSYIERARPVSTWVSLVNSPRFHELSQSVSDRDQAICAAMLHIIRKSGASPFKRDHDGMDCLSYVVRASYPDFVFEAVLQAWYDAREALSSTMAATVTSSALCTAINYIQPDLERITRLLDSGFSPEWEDNEGRTPLWKAAYMNGDREVIDLLLRRHANPDNGGSKGYPPILRTLHDNSHKKFVAFLEAGADANALNVDGRSILQVVLELDPGTEVLKSLCLESLIRHNVQIWNEETQSAPALDIMARQPNSPGFSEYIFRLLIEHIPSKLRQHCYDRALRAAVRTPRWAMSVIDLSLFTIFLLLQYGADPCVVTDTNGTLLHSICSRWHSTSSGHKWRTEFYCLLKRKLIDINARDKNGNTALSLAVQGAHRDFVFLLLSHGANPNTKNNKQKTPLEILLGSKCDDYSIACSHDEIEGDSVNDQYRGERGQAEWHFTLRSRRMEVMESLNREEVFQSLREYGADLNVLQEETGRNLLMMACENRNSVLAANILYSVGERDISGLLRHRDMSGQTAYHLAARAGCTKTMRTLLTPFEIFQPTPNVWRAMAVEGERQLFATEDDSEITTAKARRAAYRQVEEWERAGVGVPSFMKGNVVQMDRPDVPRMTIGSAARKEWDNICLPNVTVTEWDAPRHRQNPSYPNGPQYQGLKTPLQLAAENGHLEVVKLLLSALELECEDVQQAADLALEKDFYDIHAELCDYSSVERPDVGA
ncbi:hypothetical protein PRZ48_012805 [Zasmidium cellare]|uniref:Ankyrin n=1 Tax=Zasmidium cellare TaxID=395010 RepID=A0ABR0E6H6_ZASCE|nr:hypothetical protein PRZ48_012805 [Zasmidium cellare]